MSSDANPKLPTSIDLEAVRAKLAQGGKRYWQSLDEVSGTRRYQEFLENEFPPADKPGFEVGRRDVLKIAAASAALAGLSACTKLPTERIVPYVKPPEEVIPGLPLFYATSMPLAGVASGLVVESHMGRPTKVEGNKDNPGSLGATDVFAQCSTLGLYDPDRSRIVVNDGRLSTWDIFLAAISDAAGSLPMSGAGFSILTEVITSPSLAAQIKAVQARFPQAKWHQYEPLGRDNVRAGAQLAFGKPVNTVYKLDQADVIVSLDADFINCGPGHVRYARDFASRRVIDGTSQNLNRLYVVESMPTTTGGIADHRHSVRASDVGRFAQELAAAAELMGFAGNSGPQRRARCMDQIRRERSRRASRLFGCNRRRRAASNRSRPRARHERRARQCRQDGRLHRRARSESGQRNRLAVRPRFRHALGKSSNPADPRRQSRL